MMSLASPRSSLQSFLTACILTLGLAGLMWLTPDVTPHTDSTQQVSRAPAPQTTKPSGAITVTDQVGDVDRLGGNSPVPLESIDISKVTYKSVRFKSSSAIRVRVHIQDLRTVEESSEAVQAFAIAFQVRKRNPTATIEVTQPKARIYTGPTVTRCKPSSTTWNFKANTMTATIPIACLGGNPRRTQTSLFLIDNNDEQFYGLDASPKANI